MKRVLAVLASSALLAGSLALTGLSGEAESVKGTSVYDLTGGSLHSLSDVNMEMADNGENAQAVGGAFGGAVQRARGVKYTIPVSDAIAEYVMNPIGDSRVNNFYNGPNVSPNGWGFSSGFPVDNVPHPQQEMGATFLVQNNLADVRFTIMTNNDETANKSKVELSASDRRDGTFRPLTVKRTAVPAEDWYTPPEKDPPGWNYTMNVYSLADMSELEASDMYIKLVYTKPDTYAGMSAWDVQIAAIDYTVSEQAIYTPQEITSADFGNVCVERFGTTDVRFYSNGENVSPRPHGITIDIKQPESEGGERPSMTEAERTLGGIFTTNVPFLNYDIRDVKFHMVYDPGFNSDYDGREVKLSVAAEKDGPYTPVEVKKSIDPDGAKWYSSFVYSIADPASVPAGMRYVKFEFVVSPNVDLAYKTQLWRFDFGKTVNVDNSSTGELVYRTTNMTNFKAQFHFMDGTEDEPEITFYAADINRADAYRKIDVERKEGTVSGLAAPQDWKAFVYAPKNPADLPENADYLRVEIHQSSGDTYDACQLMAIAYEYDNTYTTSWEIRNNQAPSPVRIGGFQMVENPYPEAVGGKHAYQIYGASEGYLVFRAEQIQNFRLAFSFASAVERDNAEYTISVAPHDMDEEYVEIETTYDKGLDTTVWPNYFITPYDYHDIPAGNNYIKIESKGGFILVYMETDKAPESGAFQQANDIDLADGRIILSNMRRDGGALVAADKTREASAVFPADKHSWFKASLTADTLPGGGVSRAAAGGVTYFTADTAEGPWTPADIRRILAKDQPENGVAFQDAPVQKNTGDKKASFIKMVVSPEAAAANTRLTALTVHQDSPEVKLPDHAVCPENWKELRDNFESDYVMAEDGGKADYYESLAFETVGYGYSGDTVKALCRIDPDTDAFVTYRVDEPLRYFDVRAMRFTHIPNTHFVFYVSADGENWEEVSADAVAARSIKYEGGREQTSYMCDTLPDGMTYLKIEFPILETEDLTEIALTNVQLFYGNNPDGGGNGNAGGNNGGNGGGNPSTGVPAADWPGPAALLAAMMLLAAKGRRARAK